VCWNGIKGQEELKDSERKGRRSTSRTEESTEAIQKCLVEGRTLNVPMLEDMTGRSRETVHMVLVEDCFVPHLLTPDQEHQ
jgi:hypothetical protein